MENMLTLSRMENIPTPPIAPPPPQTPPAYTPPEDLLAACPFPSLAMAYVPMQQWRALYEPDVAFPRGTLFVELDKPFIGEEVRF